MCAVRRVSIVGKREQNRDYYSNASACKMDIVVVVVVAAAAVVVTSQSIRFVASSSLLDVACPVSTAIHHDFRHRPSSSILRYLPSITIFFGFEGRPPPTYSNCELILPFRRRRRSSSLCFFHRSPLFTNLGIVEYHGVYYTFSLSFSSLYLQIVHSHTKAKTGLISSVGRALGF